MEGYVILKFYFEDFFLGFPFRAKSVECGMITIAICTFCLIFIFLILMTWLSAFCTFLQNPLLWPYFWQLNHRWGFGIYTFVFWMRKPTSYFLGNFLAISCHNLWIRWYQPSIIPPLQFVRFCNSLVIFILSGCLLHSCLPFPSTRPHIWSSSAFCEV